MDINSFSGPILVFHLSVQNVDGIFEEMDVYPTLQEAIGAMHHFLGQGFTDIRIDVKVR